MATEKKEVVDVETVEKEQQPSTSTIDLALVLMNQREKITKVLEEEIKKERDAHETQMLLRGQLSVYEDLINFVNQNQTSEFVLNKDVLKK